MSRLVSCGTLCLVLLAALPAYAADTWRTGFNNTYAFSYAVAQGPPCPYPDCPGDVPGHSYNDILTAIDNGYHHHITSAREWIPLALFAKNYWGDSTYWQPLTDVLSAYYAYNMFLVLAPAGAPAWQLPSWLGGGNPCAVGWDDLRNQIAGSVAWYLNWVKTTYPFMSTWMATKLIVEPWNEMNAWPCYNTGWHGASLQNTLSWYLNYFGVQVYGYSMPSYIGNAGADVQNYVSSYYANGGQGYPQMHMYPFGSTLTSYTQQIYDGLASMNAALPAQWQGRIILGEAGNPRPGYPGAWASAEDWNNMLLYIAANQYINGFLEFQFFWKSTDDLLGGYNHAVFSPFGWLESANRLFWWTGSL